MKKIIILFLCFLSFHLMGQGSVNPRIKNPNGINISAGGPGVYGFVSYDHFTSSTLNIEVGAGPATLFGGAKYHFGGDQNNKNWTPYMGGYVIYIWLFDLFDDDDDVSSFGAYVPVGIQYLGDGGFTFGLEAAVLVGGGNIIPFGALKLGYHF